MYRKSEGIEWSVWGTCSLKAAGHEALGYERLSSNPAVQTRTSTKNLSSWREESTDHAGE